ncbi:MAG: DUF1330 domain-containing protein [Candidatus Rokuibacteriota bacterium]
MSQVSPVARRTSAERHADEGALNRRPERRLHGRLRHRLSGGHRSRGVPGLPQGGPPPTFAPYGGKAIVVDGQFEVLEGMLQPRAIVVVEFESLEQARRWYASPEYARSIPPAPAGRQCEHHPRRRACQGRRRSGCASMTLEGHGLP